MELSAFIFEHFDEILLEWVGFVRDKVPIAEAMDDVAISDEASTLLRAIAAHVAAAGSGEPSALAAAAGAHAHARVLQGFTLDQMLSEYRALRAGIFRKWTRAVGDFCRESHDDQLSFNAVVDTALAESATQYANRLELARDLFLGVLGHDLRTPLAAIAHSTTILRHEEASDDMKDEAVERISNCARRMDRMIQDLLDFTRTRLGTQLPMSPSPCDLEAVCKQALDELCAFHPEAPIVFNAVGDLQGTWDCERIAQLVSNLVDNALRYREGDIPVTVDMTGGTDRIEISVHNVGKVIPLAEQKAIFDPLRRGVNEPQAASAGAGLGLGLYIAQQIAAAHGGGIRLASSAAEGTRFVVTLAREGPRPASGAAPA